MTDPKDEILVTGGTGFLGRTLVPYLARIGYRQRVLTRNPQHNRWLTTLKQVKVVSGDLLDIVSLRSAAQGCRYVVHAGGLFSMWNDAESFRLHNVIGTRNLLCTIQETEVERIVHVSSIAVIGKPSTDPITEETPANPADAYQSSKLATERVVWEFANKNVNAVILRPGAFYGPFGQYAFNRLFFRDPMRGVIMQIHGGHHVIFPAFIRDVAHGIHLALEKGRNGELYNLCGDPITHRHAFDIVCDEAKLMWPRLNVPEWLGLAIARFLTGVANYTQQEPFWPQNLSSYVFNDWRVSTEKATRELGFIATDFRAGVRETLAWYQNNCPAYPRVD